jgi:hypothetical protein
MKMKFVTTFAAIALATLSASAQADGFRCQTTDGDLNVTIYNHTNPEVGTRVAAVMVVSDPAIGHGRKTIARFTQVNGVLESRSSRYEANVDLRFNDSSRKGELILGTKLGQLDAIIADIDFSYGAPVAAGEEVEGKLILVKRNGDRIRADLNCARYLKGE